MKKVLLTITCLTALYLAGCAAYNQLKPDPLLSPTEQGYIELKKDLELKKQTKYYIAFPAPLEDKSFLVLETSVKGKVASLFTAEFIDQKTIGTKIADAEASSPKTLVYPMTIAHPTYYWIIENVGADMNLTVKYRYVPQWRYTFETKYSSYTQILRKNRVDRSVYTNLGTSFHFESFNFASAIDTVTNHNKAIDALHAELLAIESVFPAKIINSQDRSYISYTNIKRDVEDELKFGRNYLKALDFFYKESKTRGNTPDFIVLTPQVISYFGYKDSLPENIFKESQAVVQRRLNEVPFWYNQQLAQRTDATPLDTGFFKFGAFSQMPVFCGKAGVEATPELRELHKFVFDFNTKCRQLALAKDTLGLIAAGAKAVGPMPSDSIYKAIGDKQTAVLANLPALIDAKYGKYQSFSCSDKFNQEVNTLKTDGTKQLEQYKFAATMVAQLNILKNQKDYRGMIRMLKADPQAAFLNDRYKELDRLSLGVQTVALSEALAASSYQNIEQRLLELNTDEMFLDLISMIPPKRTAVLEYEDSLYNKIEKASRARIAAFLEAKINQLENVDSLYMDSVFFPVYAVSFTSGGRGDLTRKRDELIADLAKTKENEFPAKAVKLLYEQFIKNPDDNGVLKARAIVTHGTHYKGIDKDIRNRIAECDPKLAKSITKPMEYRRVFALPTTDSKRGKNKYVVRLNVNIPTDANFPIYDINIKLPKEIAQNSASEQWFDEISVNKSPLKNEGRFTITAPTAANNYECQISPVSMNKDKSNILEVSFSFSAFQPFPISVMVQKPIMKKN